MLLSEVVSQERRHSSAIKMARRDSALSTSSEASTCSKKNKEKSSRSPSIPRTLQRRRRSSFFKGPYYPDPNFTWKASEAGNWAIVQADGSEISLVFRKSQTSSMKNFGLEVRGIRDVYNLLEDAGIILSPKSTRLKDLVKEMVAQINKSLDGSSGAGVNYEDVKQELFTDARTETFATTLQGYLKKEHREPIFDPSWLCAFCNLSTIKRRFVAIARMKQPTNFGDTCQEVRFFILVLCPSKSKETKTALETSRTFATLFSDPNLRNLLLDENTVAHFKGTLSDWASRVSIIPPINGEAQPDSKDPEDGGASGSIDGMTSTTSNAGKENSGGGGCCNGGGFGSGIVEDLKRRLPHYASDFTDGIADGRAISKTISTSVFLFFACLLPTIAFATLNSKTTKGRMDVRKGIFSQTVGQLIFSVIGGQHLSILLTTAPLSLFVKIIFSLSEMFEIVDQFEAFYCCVGLWTSFFLLLSALFNLSRVMKFCTRSTEEIFALFISIAFIVYAAKDTIHEFQANYNSEACETTANLTFIASQNQNDTIRLPQPVYRTLEKELECHRDSSLLYLLLMFGTFWFGFTLYNFKNTPFLPRSKREILSDYSLPLAVVLFSFIGSFLFEDVPSHRFNYDESKPLFQLAPFYKLDWYIIGVSAGLGFCLSVLIFMDQNIGSAIVNNPSNKLTKGESYNWDLVVISIINGVSSLFALPWLHVALPHAPMHVKCLADIEERVEHGHIKQTVVRVRETRLTTILSHILMGLSLLLLPYPLSYILPSVFDGLYLYMGITALAGNHLFERILLIFTEQLSYPPTHYIRQVPQRKIHLFTLIQVVQLLILCVLGFFPYPFVEVLFPLMLLFLLFTRQKILPHVIEKKFLDVLDD